MKNTTRDLYLAAAKLNPSKVSLIIFLLSLAMFVIAAGAPEAGGGIIR